MNPSMLTEEEIRILLVIKAGGIGQTLQHPDQAQRMPFDVLTATIDRMRVLAEALNPGTKQ